MLMHRIITAVFLTAAAVFDGKSRRIPNWIPCGMVAVHLIDWICTGRWNGISLAGLVCGIVFFILWKCNLGLGGGDFKLLTALALTIGEKTYIAVVFTGFFLSGITAAVLVLFFKKSKKEKIPLAVMMWAGFIFVIAAEYL